MSIIGTVLDVIPKGIYGAIGSALLSQLGNLVRIDHPMTHEFAVEIDGILSNGFESVEGLSDRSTPYEINEITSPYRKPILPNKRQIGLVTLKKSITYRGQLEEWYYNIADWQRGNKSPARDIDFIQLQRMDKRVPYLGGQLIEVKRWSYPKCVVRDYTGPKWGGEKSDISKNEFIVQTLAPQLVKAPTNFGSVGVLLDAITK